MGDGATRYPGLVYYHRTHRVVYLFMHQRCSSRVRNFLCNERERVCVCVVSFTCIWMAMLRTFSPWIASPRRQARKAISESTPYRQGKVKVQYNEFAISNFVPNAKWHATLSSHMDQRSTYHFEDPHILWSDFFSSSILHVPISIQTDGPHQPKTRVVSFP
jgi:hypothetical protein